MSVMGVHRNEWTLHAFFAVEESGAPADKFLAPGFEMIGSIFARPDAPRSGSMTERRAQLDATYESWFVEQREVLRSPDGRLVAILARTAMRDGKSECGLGAGIFEFRDELIVRATMFQDVDAALLEAGIDGPYKGSAAGSGSPGA